VHRVKVRVVEDALDANTTIANANREEFGGAGVTVVNLMSAPGAGKTTLLERVLVGGLDGVRHLDANMVRSALPALPLDDLDLLVIENVGNLVCPAEFRVGEDARIMVSSVAEGDDKPLKYPLMFRACELVVLNKLDLLPHVDFDVERFLHNLEAVHPGVAHLLVSARTGEGVDELRDWLSALPARTEAQRAAV
jgi:hydrogenase nickel incorporation protein HypB